MTSKRKNFMKQADLFKLGDVLRAHCRSSVDGHAVYDEGWDDELVLAEVNEKHPGVTCSISNVKGLRKSLFGDPKKPAKPGVSALLTRIERLEEWAAARPVQRFVRAK